MQAMKLVIDVKLRRNTSQFNSGDNYFENFKVKVNGGDLLNIASTRFAYNFQQSIF